jgi:signal transduction histidine kinase
MTDATPTPTRPHALALQKQTSGPSRQPLEVYHLSHDLRGPLNSILGFAELLLEEIEGPLNETQQADISAIYQSAQNLLHLINTVVDLSKLEADRLTFDPKKIDLNEVIEAALPNLIAEPGHPGLVNQIGSNLPPVWADRDRLTQMIKSLLKFAFKATKKGPITLTAWAEATDVILRLEIAQVSSSQAEGTDLFDLTVNVDSTGRTALGRGGLELPLVRALAEKQGGRVWAESHGDVLTIYTSLPAPEPTTTL